MSVSTTTPVSSAGAPAPASSSGALPVSGTFSLWQMLMALLKYQKSILDLNANQQKLWAQNLGGPNGIYAKLYQIGCDVGKDEANALESQAIGGFASMGVGLATVGLSLGAYYKQTNPQLNQADAMMKNATNMEGALLKTTPIDKSVAGVEFAQQKPLTEIDAKGLDRLDGWANGSEPLSHYSNKADLDLNERAIAHSANDATQRNKILERINSEKEDAKRMVDAANTKYNSFAQMANIGSDALSKAATAGGQLGAAKADVEKGEDSAAQTIVSQVQQQVTDQQKKAEDKAQAALSEAKQDAQAFAQAAAAQVHA
jgi:hypothetical protein